MLPLAQWPLADRRRITGVLTDIDDTLTTNGAISADALQALHDLRGAGFAVVAITGRPAGWSEPFAQTWPVDAIVAENGAVALRRATRQINDEIGLQPLYNLGKQLSKSYIQDAEVRASNRARLDAAAAQILAQVPEARLARDSAGRETDIAIDHSEFSALSPALIARVVALLRGLGMHVTVSSIHINAWFGDHDKWEGARWIVRLLWGRTLETETDRWAYVGDSANDVQMFGAFGNSIGVANIAAVAAQLPQLPRYVTNAERGAGFAETARLLLQAR